MNSSSDPDAFPINMQPFPPDLTEIQTLLIGEAVDNLATPTGGSALESIFDPFMQGLNQTGLKYDPVFVKRFLSSLAANRFVIFGGITGSGKTKLAQSFAYFMSPSLISETDGSPTMEVVEVRADWHGSESILGYPNALEPTKYETTEALLLILRACKNPTTPHFLILDEMNLSHVELYFADILSALESGEPINLYPDSDGIRKSRDNTEISPNLKLPSNLFIVGTVNNDETTRQFSPKVLDRANVLEFTVTEEMMTNYLDSEDSKHSFEELKITNSDQIGTFFLELCEITDIADINSDPILQLWKILSSAGHPFAFRVARDIRLFVKHQLSFGIQANDAIDHQILQKFSPR